MIMLNNNLHIFESDSLNVKNMVLDYKADIGISTSPYLGLAHKCLMKDRIVSIDRDKIERFSFRLKFLQLTDFLPFQTYGYL